MANVFDKIGDIRNDVKRNNFDWSHDNNFTTGLGRIIPVFCTQVPAGSSLRINPTFGLQFMPMMFPVQTKVKAYLSAYRMPLRALWADYKDWVSSANDQTSNLEPPYMSFPSKFKKGDILGVSGLSDYIGLPVTMIAEEAVPAPSLVTANPDENRRYVGNTPPVYGGTYGVNTTPNTPYSSCASALFNGDYADIYVVRRGFATVSEDTDDSVKTVGMRCTFSFTAIGAQASFLLNQLASLETSQVMDKVLGWFAFVDSDSKVRGVALFTGRDVKTSGDESSLFVTISSTCTVDAIKPVPSLQLNVHVAIANATCFINKDGSKWLYDDKTFNFAGFAQFPISENSCPYTLAGKTDANSLKISAYPYRTYEAIYNAYIRNNKNNPFLINGKPTYNKWIPTDAGGADTTEYELHRSNWASDMFTTAVPSPQQGQAPLVGITTYADTRTLENGHTETTINTALVDEDGNKYKVNYESNGEELKNVSYTKLSSDTPVKPLSSLYDLVTSGISINDFRNVNAYQRYLELNMFRGYSYKDIVEGRFDVNIRYDDLNMPEYLGGCTRDVVINPITQTVQTNNTGSYDGALGSQAGLGLLRGDCENISCYCDEESIVMVLLSVVPMPIYSQALPKYLLYRERLDSFNPEFDHIGFQPIRMSEVAPIQQWLKDDTKMNDVFGYQRPWYEYCQQLDTAHGLFKTDLRNFLINRVFGDVPVLGSDFTTVDESEVNDVFAVTDVSDKILGQIHFDITAKLPISRVVVPKLE